MYIKEIIAQFYAEVHPNDRIAQVLDRINELHLHQLPIVENGDFLGLIREEDLLASENDHQRVGDLKRTAPFVYLYDTQHIYDALQMMTVYGHDVLPVVDKEHKYLGITTQKAVLEALNATLANTEAGAVIVLEMDSKDYALSHVAHIIESENTRILSIASRHLPESGRMEMTIKVNKNNIASITASLWRFDYVVKATFNDGSDHSDIQDRYGLLMSYLDL